MRKKLCTLLLLFCFTLLFVPAASPVMAASAKSTSVKYKNTFRKINGKIYYYDGKGKRVKKAWKTIKGQRYYFYSDGHAATGFKTIGKKKYCFTSTGIMRKSWYQKGTLTYYFSPKTGVMKTGWLTLKGKSYYFKSSGILAKNQWIGTKYVNASGVYDSSKKKPLAKLENQLRSAIKNYQGTWSVYVKNLDTNQSITINNRKIYAASLIKLYAMGAVYDRIAQGKIKESSVKNTIRQMITVSSNDAFHSIVRKIGKTYINSWCKKNGYSDTNQGHGLSYSTNNYGLSNGTGSNVTTVKDCGKFLESVYRGTCVNPSYSKKMLGILKEQQRRSKIPAGVPSNVTVANKTGETNDTTHDAAIVYSKGATYIICVMANTPGSGWFSAKNVTSLSRITYNYFN